jgi:hypothetical protein
LVFTSTKNKSFEKENERKGKTGRREGATIHPIFSGLSLNPLYLLLQRKPLTYFSSYFLSLNYYTVKNI